MKKYDDALLLSVEMGTRAHPSPVARNFIEIRKKILNIIRRIMKCEKCNNDMIW